MLRSQKQSPPTGTGSGSCRRASRPTGVNIGMVARVRPQMLLRQVEKLQKVMTARPRTFLPKDDNFLGSGTDICRLLDELHHLIWF